MAERVNEPADTGNIALAIMCKAPLSGASKTRLCPPLTPDEAARLSRAFIADVAAAIAAVPKEAGTKAIAVVTPADAQAAVAGLLPPGFAVMAQRGRDLSARLIHATADLLAEGFAGVCLINADSPTLPVSLLERAAEALRRPGERLVIGPAIDGGYTLIGLKRPRPEMFRDMAWSTSAVLAQTLARAAALGPPVTLLPTWYDVDDAASLGLLSLELFGGAIPLGVEGLAGSPARHTRQVLAPTGKPRLPGARGK